MSFRVRECLERYRTTSPVGWFLLEQDYALSWVLYGITQVPELYNHLIFKGGTCLKKCYFGNYRFSQDLDFSVQGNCPTGEHLEALINTACEIATKTLKSTQNNVTFACTRYIEKRPHPNNQEAFSVFVQYPWQREALTRVMVEITFSEVVYLPIQMCDLLHGYGDELTAKIPAYALEEVVAEKISALLSFSKKLHERGWGRSRVRDYYDLWRILTSYGDKLTTAVIWDVAIKKCARKNLVLQGVEDIFAENLMDDLEKSWDQWVRPLVVDLPAKDLVIGGLKEIFKNQSWKNAPSYS